jgi:hypothetical protein
MGATGFLLAFRQLPPDFPETSLSISRHSVCEFEAILTVQRLPAANTLMAGLNARNNG